jgi:hypothetical protein
MMSVIAMSALELGTANSRIRGASKIVQGSAIGQTRARVIGEKSARFLH